MDAPAELGRVRGQREGDECQERGRHDDAAARPHECDQRRDAGSGRADRKPLRRLLMRSDRRLIDTVDASDRLRRRPPGRNDRHRDDGGEDDADERRAQERAASRRRRRGEQRRREELSEERRVIEQQMKVHHPCAAHSTTNVIFMLP
jgi:hypothetical protein